jgi:polysaccharide export outer membrane protein
MPNFDRFRQISFLSSETMPCISHGTVADAGAACVRTGSRNNSRRRCDDGVGDQMKSEFSRFGRAAAILMQGLALLSVAACSSYDDAPHLEQGASRPSPVYLIGPGDSLHVFVWGNPDLSETVPVRPDGQITLPLVPAMPIAGKTSVEVAAQIEDELKKYVKNPIVSVMITAFRGPYSQQVRVVGEAAKPQALQYNDGMTVLDVMIQVGGITQFAAGNRAILVRNEGGKETKYQVHLTDLLNDGDLSANVAVLPGDILVIPQSWF